MGANESKQQQGKQTRGGKGGRGGPGKPKRIESPVLSWGNGSEGQLGLTESKTSSPHPELVPGLAQIKIVSISCGPEHSAFLSG